ncbi:MAG: hypothetical protein H7Z42_11690, partial [Roseiflexaceae bacterium]|nr:hypothetical protein [Roseiflexaceae bacterium]
MHRYQRFSTSDAALGIQVACHEHGPDHGWFWQHVAPLPPWDWNGPYDAPEEAHAAAIKALLSLAAD